MEESVKESSLTVKDIKIDFLIPNPDNINEMTDDDLRALCAHITEVGFIAPIEVVPVEDGKYMILGGEHRWRASKHLGMTYVPSVILTDAKWTDSDVFDLTAFRMNNIRGSQNPEKFVKLYDRLAKKFGADSLKDVFAVTDKSLWKKLTKSIKTDLKKSGMPDEMIDKVDEAEKKAKDFGQFTKYMNKIFSDQAGSVENGCVIFSCGKTEHIMVHASDKVFQAMKALSSFASSQGKNVNDYLEGPLLDLLGKLK